MQYSHNSVKSQIIVHFVWQAQYLVRLAGDFSWQAQHFVTFWEIAGAGNVALYNTKSSPRSDREGPRSGGCEMTILSSDIVGLSSDYRRISSNRLSIGGSNSGILRWNVDLRIWFRGRRTIWWGWRVTLLAPRIGNDVSNVSQIPGDIDFAWQAQHLVRLEGDFACSAHWKWRFICVADHWSHWFCVTCAAIWWGWMLTVLAPRIGNDVAYVMRIVDDIDFVWQAQYLVRLAGDFSWQAQHFVTFWEIAGARNVAFYNTKSSPRSDREGPRSGGCEMTILSSDIVGLSSDPENRILITINICSQKNNWFWLIFPKLIFLKSPSLIALILQLDI